MTQSAATLADLLPHMDWVRRYARRLARDSHLAEDLVQSTWVTAIEKPPADKQNFRGWLTRVLKNNWLRVSSRESRNKELEYSELEEDQQLPTDEFVARNELLEKVAQAAYSLREPYPNALLQRYFDGLTPTQIAGVQSVPVSTVKCQLNRGLKQLRGELDTMHNGDRRRWMALLLPPGWMLVARQLPLAAGLLLMVAGAWSAVTLFGGPGVAPEPTVLAGEREPGGAAAENPVVGSSGEDSERTEIPAGEDPGAAGAAAAAAAAANTRTFTSKVLDTEGQPVPGIAVRLASSDSSQVATTDANGQFRLPMPLANTEVVPVDTGYVVVLHSLIEICKSSERDDGGNPTHGEITALVVARTLTVKLVVVDAEQRALKAAKVEYFLPVTLPRRFHEAVNHATPRDWVLCATDEKGGASATIPDVRDAWLRVSLPAHIRRDVPITTLREAGVRRVVLEKAGKPIPGLVTGRVVDQAMQPVAGAAVAMGEAADVTDAGGYFAVEWAKARWTVVVYAIKDGHLPARYVVSAADSKEGVFAVMQLGSKPMGISGRVLDHAGKPLRGLIVTPKTKQIFGRYDHRALASVEGILCKARDKSWCLMQTDADGRFSLPGLYPRPYTLKVLDEDTLVTFEAGPFQPGGPPITITATEPRIHERVAGQVVDAQGKPLQGVTVVACSELTDLSIRGQKALSYTTSGLAQLTGADGRFELERVAAAGAYLHVSRKGCFPVSFGRKPDTDHVELGTSGRPVDDLRIALAQNREIKLVVPGSYAEKVDEVGFVLNTGAAAPVIYKRTNFALMTVWRFGIVDRQTPVLLAPETTTHAVLFKDGKEVERFPIELQAGVTNVVRPPQ